MTWTMTTTCSATSDPSRGGGFTLVELMVVVAIIGLMVTTVSVGFETLVPRERLNTSIRNLAADLMSARASAISQNLEFRIEYDLDNQRYRIRGKSQFFGCWIGQAQRNDTKNDSAEHPPSR